MKKLIYAAAALLAFAACSKNEVVSPETGVTVDLTLRVDDATKAVFDGDSHVAWQAGDAVNAIIAPTSGAESNPGAYRYATFTIDANNLSTPVFKGSMNLMDDPAQEQMWVYGYYPSSAGSTSGTTIYGRELTLPSSQTSSQTSWDPKADVMAIEPVQLTGTPGGSSGSYTWYADLTVKFAHLFGFGCIDFGVLPEGVAEQPLKKLIIKATNAEAATNPLAGVFYVALNKDVMYTENSVVAKTASNEISITCDGTAISQSKVWFVANPGTYDVTITALTADNKLTYSRTGLVIERAKIAKPTINFKDGDTCVSTAVDITGKNWVHNCTDSYAATTNQYFFINGRKATDWGTKEGVDKMEMILSYPGAANEANYYGTPQSKNGVYCQDFNYSAGRNLSGVTVTVASAAKFVGMQTIKISAGDYKAPTYAGALSESELKVYVTDGQGKHQIGETAHIVGSTADRKGTDFYFAAGAYTEGSISVEISSFTQNYACPYISEISINPAPGITISQSEIAIDNGVQQGEIAVEVVGAEGEVAVSSEQSWIHASFADSKLSYTIDANTEEDNREGTIKISASNTNGTTEKMVSVKQLGGKYVLYTITVTYDDIKDALEAAAAETIADGNLTNNSVFNFDITADATIASKPGFKKAVKLNCKNIRYTDSTQKQTISFGNTVSGIFNEQPVYAVQKIAADLKEGDMPLAKVGKTASNLKKLSDMKLVSGTIYESEFAFADEYCYWQIGDEMFSYKYHHLTSATISFYDLVPEGYGQNGDKIGDGDKPQW